MLNSHKLLQTNHRVVSKTLSIVSVGFHVGCKLLCTFLFDRTSCQLDQRMTKFHHSHNELPIGDFQSLSGALNEQVTKLGKEKKIMKTLIITTSKSSIAKTNSYEILNLVTSFVATLYFMSRTIAFAAMPFLFWVGLISIFLWAAQFIYSWIGYKKLGSLDIGQDSVKTSIEKITSLLHHYTLQKNIYLWFAPITISMTYVIFLFDFRGVNILQVVDKGVIIFTIVTLVIATLLAIWLSKKMWEDKFNAPLENARENLKELED